METYTGRAFYPVEPRVEDVSIIDIAHSLSLQCRYAGHCEFFYPVAQHCSLLALWLADHGGSPLDCLQILLHDAAEAYLVDVPRPVKQFLPQYRIWDNALNDIIREWMGWKGLPVYERQAELDTRILVDERAQLMLSGTGLDWGHNDLKPLGVTIRPMTAQQAERQFLELYAALSRATAPFGAPQYIRTEWVGYGRVLHETSPGQKTAIPTIEVDIRGGVAQLRTDMGYPRWLHGKFEVEEVEEET
jgi:hypothetical protein